MQFKFCLLQSFSAPNYSRHTIKHGRRSMLHQFTPSIACHRLGKGKESRCCIWIMYIRWEYTMLTFTSIAPRTTVT